MSAPLRIGLVGLGLRSGIARHLAGQDLPARVTAVCDPLPARRAAAVEEYGEVRQVAVHTDLLDGSVDAVILTSPDDLHEQQAIDFLQAGVAVFVDKPLAITTEGCDRVLATAAATGTRLYVGHNMRHMPVITTMRGLILEGHIGEVRAVWCRHFVGHGVDVLLVLGAHRDAGDPGEPGRQAAVLPLRADVGAGAHDRVQPELGDGVQEAPQVGDAGEVVASGLRLVQVPGDVGLDGVQPHDREPLQPVSPLVGVDAEVVEGTGDDHRVQPITRELVAARS